MLTASPKELWDRLMEMGRIRKLPQVDNNEFNRAYGAFLASIEATRLPNKTRTGTTTGTRLTRVVPQGTVRKIEAINALRNAYSIGLLEAKNILDAAEFAGGIDLQSAISVYALGAAPIPATLIHELRACGYNYH